jgi:hypothetical protein
LQGLTKEKSTIRRGAIIPQARGSVVTSVQTIRKICMAHSNPSFVPGRVRGGGFRRFRGGMEVRVGHSTSEALFNHVYFTYAFQARADFNQRGGKSASFELWLAPQMIAWALSCSGFVNGSDGGFSGEGEAFQTLRKGYSEGDFWTSGVSGMK